jgi:CheY-like chemotaxis protein
MAMGQADFADLRVMLVGSKTHMLSLVRSVLAIVGINRVCQVEKPDRALEMLRLEHFGAIFCEELTVDGGIAFTVAVRRAPAVLEPLIPIFVLHDRARRRDVETARDLGATDVLTVPISPRTISTKLRAALKSPRPFVLAAGFFGPDRRARGRTVFAGKERRTRVPRRARVNLTLE